MARVYVLHRKEWRATLLLSFVLFIGILVMQYRERGDPLEEVHGLADAIYRAKEDCQLENEFYCGQCVLWANNDDCRSLYSAPVLWSVGVDYVQKADEFKGKFMPECTIQKTFPNVAEGSNRSEELRGFVDTIFFGFETQFDRFLSSKKTAFHVLVSAAIDLLVPRYQMNSTITVATVRQMSAYVYTRIDVLKAFDDAHACSASNTSDFQNLTAHVLHDMHQNPGQLAEFPFNDGGNVFSDPPVCRLPVNPTRRDRKNKHHHHARSTLCLENYHTFDLMLSKDCRATMNHLSWALKKVKKFEALIGLHLFLFAMQLSSLLQLRKQWHMCQTAVTKTRKFRLAELEDPVLRLRVVKFASEQAKKEGITNQPRLDERRDEILDNMKRSLENIDVKDVARRRFQKILIKLRKCNLCMYFFLLVFLTLCTIKHGIFLKQTFMLALYCPVAFTATYFVPAWNDDIDEGSSVEEAASDELTESLLEERR